VVRSRACAVDGYCGAGGFSVDDDMARDRDEPFGREALAHADALYNLARYLTRDGAAADDLVQETFARCLAARRQYTLGTNMKAWLFRILRNTFIDARRRERHNPAHRRLEADSASDQDLGAVDLLRGDIEIDRVKRIVAGEIEAALRTLPEEGRTAILLDLEGLSEAEVAMVMDCAPGTVKSRLARARAALRERLKEYAR
jgi:RNA polymerase sigma-70 factor (ECF subfamily)